MRKTMFCCTALLLFSGLILEANASAQDFQKSYRVGAGGAIRIANISGNVTITGYDGEAVLVTATKEGRDRDRVEVEDRSGADRVDVTVRYPDHCNCNVDVRFDVKVPRSTSYDFTHIASVGGDVEVSNVTGKLRASSVSGSVKVKNTIGSVSASAVSGNVNVDIDRLEGSDGLKFSSVSGDVNVQLPGNLDAEVDMSTLSGALKTDLPIEVREKRYGPGRSAHGRIGSGSRAVKVSAVSGSVSVLTVGR